MPHSHSIVVIYIDKSDKEAERERVRELKINDTPNKVQILSKMRNIISSEEIFSNTFLAYGT